MSNQFFGINSTKSRRGSPGEPQGVLFQTGQGGRTVLPPISSAFPTSRFPGPAYPNQYTPRSSLTRYELSHQALYNNWPSNISAEPTFSNYEPHDRYSNQHLYFPPRNSPTPPGNPDSRKLPPLNTPGWSPPYLSASSNYHSGASMVRSPTAAYPPEYTYPSHAPSYPYMPAHNHDHINIQPMHPPVHVPSFEPADFARTDHRSASPYGRSSSNLVPRSSTPPPTTPTEEPGTKKKRKRADAYQLKVLNETYDRTAFPSTEERNELAKKLAMSPRSVQIWFQNKRQHMRQTNRQSVATSGDDPTQMGYNPPMMLANAQHQSRHPADTPRSHAYQSSSSSHRRTRHHEEPVDHRNWSTAY